MGDEDNGHPGAHLGLSTASTTRRFMVGTWIQHAMAEL